jgi:hypothetical protein
MINFFEDNLIQTMFKVAFDNAFAGKTPLHEVPTQKLL